MARWIVIFNLLAIQYTLAEDCADTSVTGADASDSTLAFETQLMMANPGSNRNQQSFLRFVNPNDSAATIEVYGVDDLGNRSRSGALSFTLEANAARQITTQDIEDGNTDKGLTNRLCEGLGKWRLRVRSDAEIRVMGLIRTGGGFLTSLNEVVPKSDTSNVVYFANPASNTNQQTFLRIVNTTGDTDTVTLTGIDDNGTTSAGVVTFTLTGHESKQITAQDLELGNGNKGLSGNLDDGVGKWRLLLTSALNLQVMSLIRTPDGFLTNLSDVVESDPLGDHVVYFANPASETIRTTFLRIINTSNEVARVSIEGSDDNGTAAPGGDVTLTLGSNEAIQLTARDLEEGNGAKGLSGSLGDGVGRWRLTIGADTEIKVMSLVRTPDGFLTNLSRSVPRSNDTNDTNDTNDVFVFNPGSNTEQRSSLRLVNNSSEPGNVTVTGVDDAGVAGEPVTFTIPANAAMTVSSQDLESGNGELGLDGALGDGTGKWRLAISSDVDLKVLSLLDTPAGFVTNLSRPVERHISAIAFPDEALADCVAQTGAIYVAELTRLSCFLKGVADTSGVEQLTSLVELDLSGNQLTNIDISRNAVLETLDLSDNQLDALNVTNNPALSQLDVTNNNFSCIDIELIERDSAKLDTVTHDEDCGSNWIPNQFLSLSLYSDQCASPRDGLDGNNRPFDDVQGRVLDENNWLRSMSNLVYLWYDEIIDRDPGEYETPAYFDLLKTEELTESGTPKDKFHFTVDTAVYDEFTETGTLPGGSYGATFVFLESSVPREIVVSLTQPGSPAAAANLSRGARILEVDGADVINGDDDDTIFDGLFPREIGEIHDFTVMDLDATEPRSFTMTAAQAITVPVHQVQTIETGSGTVGYLLFTNHISTAEALLIDAVNELKAADITDLVVDLRYNGGGFLDIASEFGYMIAGSQSAGRTFERPEWNDQHRFFDPVTGRFLLPIPFHTTAQGFSVASGTPLPTLNLNRVFVLTGSGTCSASEALMNSLRGIDVEVIQVGTTTCGKPYGFYGLDNCGTTYFTIQFRGVNAKDFGDYGDGFVPENAEPLIGTSVPGCTAPDDYDHGFGDPEEARLATALAYRETGSCPVDPVSAARALRTGNPMEGKIYVHPLLENRLMRRPNTR